MKKLYMRFLYFIAPKGFTEYVIVAGMKRIKIVYIHDYVRRKTLHEFIKDVEVKSGSGYIQHF